MCMLSSLCVPITIAKQTIMHLVHMSETCDIHFEDAYDIHIMLFFALEAQTLCYLCDNIKISTVAFSEHIQVSLFTIMPILFHIARLNAYGHYSRLIINAFAFIFSRILQQKKFVS